MITMMMMMKIINEPRIKFYFLFFSKVSLDTEITTRREKRKKERKKEVIPIKFRAKEKKNPSSMILHIKSMNMNIVLPLFTPF